MTNYDTYPAHRFCSGSCVIHFASGGYSWCMLGKGTKEYLYNSHYIDGAKIDILVKGKKYQLTDEQFREWIKTGIVDEKCWIPPAKETDMLCPDCGKPLMIRKARKGPNAGKEFLGCSGYSSYPKCYYTRQIEEDEDDKNSLRCPRCNQKLVLRTSKYAIDGKKNKFYGCLGYPRCKYIQEIDNLNDTNILE